MNKLEAMYNFIKLIEDNKMLTIFIKNIFDYQEINDYNYLFRLTSSTDSVIIDIYDNISKNRFNRYIFNFNEKTISNNYNNNNVYITNINVLKAKDSDNKLLKLAYLFNLDNDKMIEYAKTFLDKDIINILNKVISKSTFE